MTELEKMKAVQEKSQAIGEFLEWLRQEKEYVLVRFEDQGSYDEIRTLDIPVENLLAEFFNIDLNKAEEEKRAILKKIRSKA